MKTITQRLRAQAYVALINRAHIAEFKAINAKKIGDAKTARRAQRRANTLRRQAVAKLTAPAVC